MSPTQWTPENSFFFKMYFICPSGFIWHSPPESTRFSGPGIHTHELINLHISAMAYYINGERSWHGRCEPKYSKDGDLF